MGTILGERSLPGALSISRPHGVRTPHISITVEDRTSGSRFLEVAVPLDEFARALTGLGGVECEFILSAAYVGKVREFKLLQVAVREGDFANREERATQAVSEYEVDGWSAHRRDALNSHNVCGRGEDEDGRYTVYNVGFVRFVDRQDAATDGA